MSKHGGKLYGKGVLSGAVYLTSSLSFPAMAAGVSPPPILRPIQCRMVPSIFPRVHPAGERCRTCAAGPGAHPHVSNDEFSRHRKAADLSYMGDPNSPILQLLGELDAIRKRNELIISGNPGFLPRASCWPLGVTEFLLVPMTMAVYFVQGPKEVVMIQAGFNDVRHIHLAEKHSTNVKTSWYGRSIGRYQKATRCALVVDTIGLFG